MHARRSRLATPPARVPPGGIRARRKGPGSLPLPCGPPDPRSETPPTGQSFWPASHFARGPACQRRCGETPRAPAWLMRSRKSQLGSVSGLIAMAVSLFARGRSQRAMNRTICTSISWTDFQDGQLVRGGADTGPPVLLGSDSGVAAPLDRGDDRALRVCLSRAPVGPPGSRRRWARSYSSGGRGGRRGRE